MGLYISDAAIHIYHKSLPSLLQLIATGIGQPSRSDPRKMRGAPGVINQGPADPAE